MYVYINLQKLLNNNKLSNHSTKTFRSNIIGGAQQFIFKNFIFVYVIDYRLAQVNY